MHCAVRLPTGPLSATPVQPAIGLAPSRKSTVEVGAVPTAGAGAVAPSNATVAVDVTGWLLFRLPDTGARVVGVLNRATFLGTMVVSKPLKFVPQRVPGFD